jgi:hypothetical protein
MARRILVETGYTFSPSTKTVTIPTYIPRERLLLITNVTTNQVIYNFSDPTLKATSYTSSISASMVDTTTIVLQYNTASMSSTDKLQITIDEPNETFDPSPTLLDPTNKLRVTQPQALIDTDFEYGTQVSKWENLSTTNNRPYSFQSSIQVPNITGIAISGRTVTVTTSVAHGLTVGTPITVQDTFLGVANGNFIIESVTTGSPFTFTYTARSANNTGLSALFDTNKTVVYAGTLYSGAQIGGAPTITSSGTAVTVTTTIPHGLSIGNEIAVTGTTAATSNPPNGSFSVATVATPTTFVYYTQVAPVGAITATSAAVFARPQGQFLHRAFDGGVIFSSNAGSNNNAAIRQTRRYFRYQSGKGIQISSGTILKPNLQIDSLGNGGSGTVITVQTKEQHNLLPGTEITVSGSLDTAYNGTYNVTNVINFNRFTYTVPVAPTSPVGTGPYYVAVTGWYGATNRLGTFDAQNGLFFEFDGENLFAVRRSSTYQLSGRVSVTNGSNTVTRTNTDFPTNFSQQVIPGDFVVIRGQSYRIMDVDDQAATPALRISPAYRGATATNVIISKTTDTKIPQSQWNLDKMDGTGPSGYNLDLAKMQMFYIDYSWYGAGFVRWGLRGTDGNVYYVHKLPNNNVNEEAYMRSGNLPARYETVTTPPYTVITASVGTTDTTLSVSDTSYFPPASVSSPQTIVLRPSSTGNNATQAIEYVTYTGKTTTSFTGVTRAQAGITTSSTVASGSNSASVTSATGIQVGQRAINANLPEGTFVTRISGTTVTLSQAATSAISSANIIFAPMGASTGQAYTYLATSPVGVELAYPTYAPSISHWGTSVIMDGRYDDDKSLLFTYGQNAAQSTLLAGTTAPTGLTGVGTSGQSTITLTGTVNTIATGMTVTGTGVGVGAVVTAISGQVITVSVANSGTVSGSMTFGNTAATQSKALFSIRVSPSVDNGIAATFGARELINRMQLILRALDITTRTANSNLLVTAVLNGVPTTATPWTNAVGNSLVRANSSLAQIADYSTSTGVFTNVTGGEITGGFFVGAGANSVDLATVRDLGNSILGGGGANANTNVYPDGPDVLTIVVTNLGPVASDVLGRLSWTEAQA